MATQNLLLLAEGDRVPADARVVASSGLALDEAAGVRGDVVEIFPTYDDFAYRITLWGDEIESLEQIDPLTGQVMQNYLRLPIYPKTHYVMSDETKYDAMQSIENELNWWKEVLEKEGKRIEAQRVWQRTKFDLEMMKQIGYCHGIENYSRHFSGRLPGQAPPTLLDYLPSDSLLFIDESHQTIPQIGGMFHGDRSRKENLVKFGFRLPSALDNRPLTFEEFENRVHQCVYVSATPGPYELTKASGVVIEQIIRPTGLIDPEVEIRPIRGQVDNLLQEIRLRIDRDERVLVTTLTKRMSEDLSQHYTETGIKCAYLHSEVSTLDRIKILRDLRRGDGSIVPSSATLCRSVTAAPSLSRGTSRHGERPRRTACVRSGPRPARRLPQVSAVTCATRCQIGRAHV